MRYELHYVKRVADSCCHAEPACRTGRPAEALPTKMYFVLFTLRHAQGDNGLLYKVRAVLRKTSRWWAFMIQPPKKGLLTPDSRLATPD